MEYTHPEVGEVSRAAHIKGSAPAPRERRWLGTAAFWFAVSLTVLVGAAVLASLGLPPLLLAALWLAGSVGLLGSTILAIVRAVQGLVELVVPSWREASALRTLAATLLNAALAGFGMLVAYVATVGFSRGRQLRRLGRVLLPGLRGDPAWTTAAVRLDGTEDPPPGVAEQWRENGKTEHASVAAFARLTLDLMALGAPPRLIADANRDALDEIRHAELCFSLAQAMDGRAVSPGPFPDVQRVAPLPRSRTLALARLAVDSLVDGALHEGVSARIVARLSRRAQVPAIRELLAEIAADEGRHAAHGWSVVAWCLAQGGDAVAAALLGALETLPKEMRSGRPRAASAGDWERWGIHGQVLESAEYSAALARVIERVRAGTKPSRRAA